MSCCFARNKDSFSKRYNECPKLRISHIINVLETIKPLSESTPHPEKPSSPHENLGLEINTLIHELKMKNEANGSLARRVFF